MSIEGTRFRAAARFGLALLASAAWAAKVQAATPDSIAIVLPEEPQTLELCESGSSIRRVTQGNVGEPLTFRDPVTGQAGPGLATSWQAAEPTRWVFKLRQGVKFHDGKAFDAESAAASFNRAMTPELECGVRQQYFQGNTYKAKAVDPTTLEITTEAPDPILPNRLSFLAVTSPSTSTTKKTLEPVGTGPYKFAGWDKGQRIKLERFDGYWGKAPPIKGVEYQWRQESSIRSAMATTGEADLSLSIASQDVKKADFDSGRAVNFEVPEIALLRFDLVSPLPPMDDVRIRRAINLAIDRKGFIDVVFNGHGSPASQIFVPATLGYDKTIEPWKYDPAEAKRLVAEAKAAGVPVDRQITIYGRLGVYENATEGMELVAAMLNQAGLNVKVEMLGLQAWLQILRSKYEPGRPTNMMQQSHGNSTGDAAFSFNPQYTLKGPFSALRDAKADQMIADAQKLPGADREKAFQEISKYLYRTVIPDAPLAITTSTMLMSKKIGYKPSGASFEEIHIADIQLK